MDIPCANKQDSLETEAKVYALVNDCMNMVNSYSDALLMATNLINAMPKTEQISYNKIMENIIEDFSYSTAGTIETD